MSDAPSPVLSPEQHARLMALELPAVSLALREAAAYRSKRWAEWLAQPGWDEFAKARERAERFLAEHGQNLQD